MNWMPVSRRWATVEQMSRLRLLPCGTIPGKERALVLRTLDERVDRVAVGRDRGTADRSELVLDGRGLLDPFGPALRRLLVRAVHVFDFERDVAAAISMEPDLLGHEPLRPERRGQREADLALLEHVGGAVPHLRLEPTVRRHRQPEGVGAEK